MPGWHNRYPAKKAADISGFFIYSARTTVSLRHPQQ